MKRHEFARTLSPKQRDQFFRLGSEIQSSMSVRLGYQVDADYCHETALAMLEAVEWKSLKAARAMTSLMRQW